MSITRIMMIKLLELMSLSHGVLSIDEGEYTNAVTFLRDNLCAELRMDKSGRYNTFSYIMQYISALCDEAREQRDYFMLQDMKMYSAEYEDNALQAAQGYIDSFINSVSGVTYASYSQCIVFWKAYYELEKALHDVFYDVSYTNFLLKNRVSDVWKRHVNKILGLRINETASTFSCLVLCVSSLSVKKLYDSRNCFTYSLSFIDNSRLRTYNNYTKGYLFDFTALSEALLFLTKDGYTDTLQTNVDSLSLRDISHILCDNLCSHAYVENNNVFMVRNKAFSCKRYYNMPVYQKFLENCSRKSYNEIVIRKPVEPVGLFYMDSIADTIIPDDVRANSFVMGIPVFCIDKEGAGIRRVS